MASVTFETTVSATGNNTGIVIPEDVIERLGAGGRPPVIVDVNGYQYRYTVGVMGGKHMIGISATVRKATGLNGGDQVKVALAVAEALREVDVPDDFAARLAADPAARDFFNKLSNSMQRYPRRLHRCCEAPETRQRRIDKAVALFGVGKQR